ncbi:helix-turn-helix domain-containing protein [Commensalibacter nepenthis]|uniref:Helix-turn-helix transcriptional regulator n=1 Tax=Commensalibacter nepenthis TaxID=3043872 RepID=A0ABT6QAR9_9PROT|nr:helix-turn-helix transcriptional regulator [Commensalibacter sp. TBRC 10068]MDI2113894.1 helix-turn-helix transcriptional regulator [Commensalibacter sp. TBRC 10068]
MKQAPSYALFTYAYNFRRFRINMLGVSQAQVAAKCKTSKSFISQVERAEVGISINKAEEFSVLLFNKTLEEMLKDKPKDFRTVQEKLPTGRTDRFKK